MDRDVLARAWAAAAVGVAVIATAAAGLALSGPSKPRPASTAVASVMVNPGTVQLGQELRSGPSDTAQCQRVLRVSCYNPVQIQQAYQLPSLYAHGITGRGATIVIVDPYGSPTIGGDLRTFDRTEGIPDPPSLRVIRPAGRVPGFSAGRQGMAAWASETTLDVEYAHTVAPGAALVLAETPGGARTGGVSMTQVVTAEKYVIAHHIGDVISQSFIAAEPGIGAAAIGALRGAYTAAYAHHVTVLSGAGDTGAAGLEPGGAGYYSRPVTGWPASDPLVTAVGGTRLNLDAAWPPRLARRGVERHLQLDRQPAGQPRPGAEPAGRGRRPVVRLRPARLPEHRSRRGGEPPRPARHLDERGVHRGGQHLPEFPGSRAGTRCAAPARQPRCSRVSWRSPIRWRAIPSA